MRHECRELIDEMLRFEISGIPCLRAVFLVEGGASPELRWDLLREEEWPDTSCG